MPTEKNAAFLPMQYGFKLDRQRVNTVYKEWVKESNTTILLLCSYMVEGSYLPPYSYIIII